MGWYAFYQVEPFGEFAEWHRAAMLAAVFFNKLRGKDEASRDENSFMPPWFRSTGGKQQTQQEQLAIMKSIFATLPHKEYDPRASQD